MASNMGHEIAIDSREGFERSMNDFDAAWVGETSNACMRREKKEYNDNGGILVTRLLRERPRVPHLQLVGACTQ